MREVPNTLKRVNSVKNVDEAAHKNTPESIFGEFIAQRMTLFKRNDIKLNLEHNILNLLLEAEK